MIATTKPEKLEIPRIQTKQKHIEDNTKTDARKEEDQVQRNCWDRKTLVLTRTFSSV
jgi:hypothetical protein